MNCHEHWKYVVSGRLLREVRITPVIGAELICETGVRDPSSCFSLISIGRIAQTNEQGDFVMKFSTKGSPLDAKAPEFLSLNIRVARGKWKEILLPVKVAPRFAVDGPEMELLLGIVEIEDRQDVYGGET